jgi:hypothetical protein
MTKLKFSDGMEFETSGSLRKELRFDGWYVVGHGMLCPVRTEEEADKLIMDITQKEIKRDERM